MCRQFLDDVDAVVWPSHSPNLNPIDPYVSCFQRRQVQQLTVQELTDGLIQVWEEIPQDTICRLMRIMPRHCRERTQSRRDHTHYWVTLWVAVIKLRWISLWFRCLTLIFGLILNPALSGLMSLVSIDFFFLLTTNYTMYIRVFPSFFWVVYFVEVPILLQWSAFEKMSITISPKNTTLLV